MKNYKDLVYLILAIVITQAIAQWAGNRLGLVLAEKIIARLERAKTS
jgi:hypothetical protein